MPCSHPLSFRDRLFSSGRDPDREGPNRVDTSSRQTSETKAAPSSLAILRRTGRDCFSSFGRLGPPFRRVAVMVVPLASPRAAALFLPLLRSSWLCRAVSHPVGTDRSCRVASASPHVRKRWEIRSGAPPIWQGGVRHRFANALRIFCQAARLSSSDTSSGACCCAKSTLLQRGYTCR
jgi:hypothetical protein